MRTPTAFDAMARWLVLTLAGVGLFALIPGTSFAAPGFASTRWVLQLHPVQFGAAIMIVLAWALFVVHVLQLGGVWRRDVPALVLSAAVILVVAATVAALVWGSVGSVLAVVALLTALQIAFCLRIDALARGGAPAPRLVRRRARRARRRPAPAL